MSINKISFGNIVKVNAAVVPAMEIASIANGYSGKTDKCLKSQISGLFPDKQKDMVLIEVMDHKTSYLFSGKEGKEYQKIYNDKKRKIAKINRTKQQSYNIDFLADKAEEEYRNRILALVNKSKNMKEINVETTTSPYKIKTINIVS